MTSSTEILRSDIANLKDQLADRKGELRALASQEQGFDWECWGDRCGILHDSQQRNGWQQMGYLGFGTKRQAQQCAQALKRQGLADRVEVRKARRLTACKWEVKVPDIEPQMLHHLARSAEQVA